MSPEAAQSVLDRILKLRKERVAKQRRRVPDHVLVSMAPFSAPPRSLCRSVRCEAGPSVIAEVKKASPSRGVLRPDLDPSALARTYEASGARAVSVITEPDFFLGSSAALEAVRAAVTLPVLRKDFLFHPYQVLESRILGADAILLIAALLDPQALRELLSLTQELGMEALVEVRNETELLLALEQDQALIGINNRNLETMKVDPGTAPRLAPLVPADRLLVVESGIRNARDVAIAGRLGAQAVLVGERLVTAADPGAMLENLRGRRP